MLEASLSLIGSFSKSMAGCHFEVRVRTDLGIMLTMDLRALILTGLSGIDIPGSLLARIDMPDDVFATEP